MSKRFAVAMAALLCASSTLVQAQDTASSPSSPKLIVTIVVDQFSANLSTSTVAAGRAACVACQTKVWSQATAIRPTA